jgi:hypothetical protein
LGANGSLRTFDRQTGYITWSNNSTPMSSSRAVTSSMLPSSVTKLQLPYFIPSYLGSRPPSTRQRRHLLITFFTPSTSVESCLDRIHKILMASKSARVLQARGLCQISNPTVRTSQRSGRMRRISNCMAIYTEFVATFVVPHSLATRSIWKPSRREPLQIVLSANNEVSDNFACMGIYLINSDIR